MFKNTLKIICGSSVLLKDNIMLTSTHTQTYLYIWIYIRNSGTVLYLMTVKLKCICNASKEKQTPGMTDYCAAYLDFCLKHLSTCFVSLHSSFISTPLLSFFPQPQMQKCTPPVAGLHLLLCTTWWAQGHNLLSAKATILAESYLAIEGQYQKSLEIFNNNNNNNNINNCNNT